MKKVNYFVAAAALAVAAATTGAVAPADAQVTIRAGERGVGVRIGDPYPQGYYSYGYVERCRTVTERKYRPNGTVVVTKKRICD